MAKTKHHLEHARWSETVRKEEKGLRAEFSTPGNPEAGRLHYLGAVRNIENYGRSERPDTHRTRLDMDKVVFNADRLRIDVMGEANIHQLKHWLRRTCPELHDSFARLNAATGQNGPFRARVREEALPPNPYGGFDDVMFREYARSHDRTR